MKETVYTEADLGRPKKTLANTHKHLSADPRDASTHTTFLSASYSSCTHPLPNCSKMNPLQFSRFLAATPCRTSILRPSHAFRHLQAGRFAHTASSFAVQGRAYSIGTRAPSLLSLVASKLSAFRIPHTPSYFAMNAAHPTTSNSTSLLQMFSSKLLRATHRDARFGSSSSNWSNFRRTFDRHMENYVIWAILGVNGVVFVSWYVARANLVRYYASPCSTRTHCRNDRANETQVCT